MGAALAAVLALYCTDSTDSSAGHPSPHWHLGPTAQRSHGLCQWLQLNLIPWAGNCTIPCYSGNGLWVGRGGIIHCTSGWDCMAGTKVAWPGPRNPCPAPPHSHTHPCMATHCSCWGAAQWGCLGSTYSSAGPGWPYNRRSDNASTEQ